MLSISLQQSIKKLVNCFVPLKYDYKQFNIFMKGIFKHFRILAIISITCFLFLSAPVFADETGDITVFIAASLTGASEEIKRVFESAYPGYTLTINLENTQTLKTQVENGALPDVFISASTKHTRELTAGGYFMNETVADLCTNWIAIVTPKDNPAGITTIADLSKPGILIAMGAEEIPVGINTRKVIDKIANDIAYGTKWKDAVYANTVTHETTDPGVVEKVKLGEVDAGFIYESSCKASEEDLNMITIPKDFNEIQFYSIASLHLAPNPNGAEAFENFMLGEEGQEILTSFGFIPVL